MTDREQTDDQTGPDIHCLQDIPLDHRPDLPRNISWSAYVDYNCRIQRCQDSCLNHADSPYAQKKLCRACYPVVDTGDLPPKILHLPAWARGLDVGDTPTTSEGEGEAVRPEAQPKRSSSRQPAQRSEQAAPTRGASGEHPGPDRERPSRSAPSRQTGSAPLWGDPEARAHTPNPEGEGSPQNDTHQSESDTTPTGRPP